MPAGHCTKFARHAAPAPEENRESFAVIAPHFLKGITKKQTKDGLKIEMDQFVARMEA
jgi:hypothetical protein